MSAEKRLVPATSDSGFYLTLVARHGRCICSDTWCFDTEDGCLICVALDPEWSCPADPEAVRDGVYPDPDLVAVHRLGGDTA